MKEETKNKGCDMRNEVRTKWKRVEKRQEKKEIRGDGMKERKKCIEKNSEEKVRRGDKMRRKNECEEKRRR